MKRLHNLFAVLALAFFGLTACEYAEDPTTDVWQPATISTPQQAITVAMNGAAIQTGKSLKVVWKAGHMGISAPVKTSLLLVDGDNEKGKVLESSVQTKWHKELQVSYQALNKTAAEMGVAFGTTKNLKLVVKAEAEGKQPLYSAPVGLNVTTFNMPAPVWMAPAVTVPASVEITGSNLGGKTAITFVPNQTGVFTPVKFEVSITSDTVTKVVGEVTTMDLVAQTVEVTNKMLNDFVVAQGAQDKEVRNVTVAIKATHTLLGEQVLTSALVSFKVKAFVIPTKLYLVGNFAGEGNSWNNANESFTLKPNGKEGELEGTFNFNTEFKILEKLGAWQPQWGDNGADGRLDNNGSGDPASIKLAAPGQYKVVVNWLTKAYTVTPVIDPSTVLYMVGALNDWNEKDPVAMNFKDGAFSKIAYMHGEFLFIPEKGWNKKFGAAAEAGKLVKNGGADIAVPATGFFNTQADVQNLTYSLTPITWGVIGDATAGGWNTDTDMTFDAATKTYSVTMDLDAKEWKMRFADKWALSVGPNAGGNFKVTEAGNYTITLTYKGDKMPLDPFNYTGGYDVKIVKN